MNQPAPVLTNGLPDLHSARRTLDRAQDAFKEAMLSPACRRGGDTDTASWSNAYYSSSTLPAFCRKYAAFRNSDSIAADACAVQYNDVVEAWKTYEFARAAEKNRKAAKRIAVAAKKSAREELNLQEGVSIEGVDVGQYKVILAGLEPVRLFVFKNEKKNLRQQLAETVDLLHVHDYSTLLANPADYREASSFDRHAKFTAWNKLDRQIRRWFSVDSGGLASLRPDNGHRISRDAEQFALAYVQGYAAKLAVKTGEVIANDSAFAGWAPVGATVSTANLWSDSIAEIALATAGGMQGRVIRFHTQIIWNRSCLGKVFNQYPTRRAA